MNEINNVNDSLTGSWCQKENESIYYNPNDLWCSVGDSWLNYVKQQIKKPSIWNLFNYVYDVSINDSVLVINSKNELYDFIDKFKNNDDDIKIYNVINWELVKNTYNRLIVLDQDIFDINTNDKMIILGNESVQLFVEKLFGDNWKNNKILLSEWIRHWETKTGVIWSGKEIKHIKLLKKISYVVESEMNEVYFVRHGETEWNRLGLGQGAENDIELNDTGRSQAMKLGNYLKNNRLDKPFDIIISSPLKRALETAQIIAKIINFDINNIQLIDDIV